MLSCQHLEVACNPCLAGPSGLTVVSCGKVLHVTHVPELMRLDGAVKKSKKALLVDQLTRSRQALQMLTELWRGKDISSTKDVVILFESFGKCLQGNCQHHSRPGDVRQVAPHFSVVDRLPRPNTKSDLNHAHHSVYRPSTAVCPLPRGGRGRLLG